VISRSSLTQAELKSDVTVGTTESPFKADDDLTASAFPALSTEKYLIDSPSWSVGGFAGS
jgi:hypothetical protein